MGPPETCHYVLANNIDTVGFVRTKEARVQDCLEVVNGQKHYSDRLLVGEFRQGLAHVDTLYPRTVRLSVFWTHGCIVVFERRHVS